MKNFNITLLIAIAVFLSFGFVLLHDRTTMPPALEAVAPMEQSDSMQPLAESNEDIW